LTWVEWIGNISEWLGVIAVALILGLSPRFKRRLIRFQYQRREITLIFILFTLIFIGSALVHAGAVPIKNQAPSYLPDGLWARFWVAAIGIIPFAAALYIRRQPLLSVGWAKSLISPALQMGLALAFVTFFLRNKVYSLTNGILPEEWNALLLCAGLAFAEESIFRGYIQTRLVSIWGKLPGWLVTSALSLTFQLPRLWAEPNSFLLTLLLIGIQSLLLGWIMNKSGHVLAPALYRLISEWVIFLV